MGVPYFNDKAQVDDITDAVHGLAKMLEMNVGITEAQARHAAFETLLFFRKQLTTGYVHDVPKAAKESEAKTDGD